VLHEVVRLLRERIVGFAYRALLIVALGGPLGVTPAFAGESPLAQPLAVAPLVLPHYVDLELDWKSRKRARRPSNIERSDFVDLNPALEPLVWPRNSDVRARLLTPALRRTPLVGWIAENLYRSRRESGWCLEVDPGEGEYVVFYRLQMK
jgi:hypothetical protein